MPVEVVKEPSQTEKELAEKIVNLLNDLLDKNPSLVNAMFLKRFPCNDQIADHPFIQVSEERGVNSVGFLGILNGFLVPEGVIIYVEINDSTDSITNFVATTAAEWNKREKPV